MRKKETCQKLIYIARSRIPSEQANAVQVLKMCAGFAAHTAVELAAPYHPEDARQADGLWERYALARPFTVRWLAFPHLRERFAVRGFALAATAYARVRRYSCAYTRDPWAAWWLARAGVRTGFEAHDLREDRRYPIWRRLVSDPAGLPGLRGVFCISRSLAEDYRAAGARPEILRVAPDGVDLQRFADPAEKAQARRALGLDPDGPWIVHAGHLYPGRGAEELVEAASALPAARILFVGGKTADIERMGAFADAWGMHERVVFAGTVPNGKVPLCLWAADILAMPYTSRTPTVRSMSPLKMFEYMAAGRPIVATDFPVIREVLRDGGNAVLIAPDSAPALEQGMRGLLADPARAERLAGQARRDVEAYTWEKRAVIILETLAG
jgi:glycosyltransferase involved in cell wall biosynthesis